MINYINITLAIDFNTRLTSNLILNKVFRGELSFFTYKNFIKKNTKTLKILQKTAKTLKCFLKHL